MKTKNLFQLAAILSIALFVSCNSTEPEPEPLLRVMTSTVSVSPEASSDRTISFSCNGAWEISIDVSWLTIDRMQGNGTASPRLTIEANPTTEQRVAIITVTSGALSEKITLTQTGTAPALSIYPTFIHAEGRGKNWYGEGVEYSINITSTTQWTAEVTDAEIKDWISINPTSGFGNGVITVSLDANLGFARRHAFIAISAGNIHRTDTVFQKGSGSLEADEFNSVTINGITWATKNVDEFGTFVPFYAPASVVGKYYQFNRPTAYSVVDGKAEPPLKYETINENSDWSILNDPCPCGWRLPTEAEAENLRTSGFRWVNEPAGAWFGTDAQTATFAMPGSAIFLPAGGVITSSGLGYLEQGYYWIRVQHGYDQGRQLYFSQFGSGTIGNSKSGARFIRCVTE